MFIHEIFEQILINTVMQLVYLERLSTNKNADKRKRILFHGKAKTDNRGKTDTVYIRLYF